MQQGMLCLGIKCSFSGGPAMEVMENIECRVGWLLRQGGVKMLPLVLMLRLMVMLMVLFDAGCVPIPWETPPPPGPNTQTG